MRRMLIGHGLLSLSGVLLAATASAQYTFVLLGNDSVRTVAYGAGGGQQAGYGAEGAGGPYPDRAYVWSGSAGSFLSLDPGGDYLESRAYATNGTMQVGWARQGAGGGSNTHAGTWAGTPETFNDMNPLGYFRSEAYAIDGANQIGYASTIDTTFDHGMVWHGDHDHYDDLHPIDKPAYDATRALDGAGGLQAGYATGAFIGSHATMWAGSYGTFVDLHPTGAHDSLAESTDGILEGGYATIGTARHAYLWAGTPDSAMDINPLSATSSTVNDMGAGYQVGAYSGPFGFASHASRWSGTADSVLDLHSFVTGGYTGSTALGIGADGTIVGNVYFAGGSDYTWACMWVPVPEPSLPVSLLVLGSLAMFRRRAGARIGN